MPLSLSAALVAALERGEAAAALGRATRERYRRTSSSNPERQEAILDARREISSVMVPIRSARGKEGIAPGTYEPAVASRLEAVSMSLQREARKLRKMSR